MTVLSGQTIRRMGVFTPFFERTVHNGMTYGLGPAGYDVRIDRQVMLSRGSCAVLASTMEHFNMPSDCIAYVKDKSTWARRFILVQNTVIEPGWSGFLTLEITYEGGGIEIIDKGSPIAQIVFHRLDEPSESPYSGKYQDQENGPQIAIDEK